MHKITEEIKKDAINRHVKWEINMFLHCYNKLNSGLKSKGGNERRVFLECFLLHSRNLMDFLWNNPGKNFYDDVLAIHFVNFHKFNKKLGNIKERINKQLLHITYDRSSPRQISLLSEIDFIYKSIIEGLEKYNENVKQEYKVKLSRES